MLKLRAIAALCAWGFLMMESSKAGAYEWVFATMAGFIASVLPSRWFVPCAIFQVALAATSLVFVPDLARNIGWLGYLFFGLNLLLNGGLYADALRLAGSVKPSRLEGSASTPLGSEQASRRQ